VKVYLHAFLTSSLHKQALGPHKASHRMGNGGSSPEVKWPGRESDHSPPSSAEVKNTWGYTSTPSIRIHGVVFN
jgi:hypothetical protein